MAKKEKLVSIIMALIISSCMGIIMTFIVRATADEIKLSSMPPALIMYISGIIESIIICVIITLLIPLGKMGRTLASKAGANPPGIKFTLLNSIPFAVINAVGCSFILCLINIVQARSHIPADKVPPFAPMFLSQWLISLLPSILLGYLLSVVVSPLVVRAVGLTGRPAGRPE
ncbi:MAG: hypothetical protein K6F79_08375 [Saccharofermentans sp.]|nr:hypothetical protein [Saccharofermentans sp.]